MSRTPTTARPATVDDVMFLADLWRGLLRDADPQDQVHDLELLVKSAEGSTEERVVVVEYDGEPAGAVLLSVTTMSPLNPEPAVRAMAPSVAPGFRRRGVGHLLIDAAVTFAEERGISHISTPVANDARAAHRFMARLAFAPQAVLRMGSTPMVRAQLGTRLPGRIRVGGRPGQVLAARRSLRRTRQDG